MGTLAALGAATGCQTAGGPLAVNGVRIGVQMYSVDDLWKPDPAAAFRKLKAMGYDGVQSVHFFFQKPEELEKMLSDNGLALVDMPFRNAFVAPDRFNEFVEFCQRFKVDFVFQPREKVATAAEWRRHAQWLAGLAGKVNRNEFISFTPLSTTRLPPRATARFRESGRPRPIPPSPSRPA